MSGVNQFKLSRLLLSDGLCERLSPKFFIGSLSAIACLLLDVVTVIILREIEDKGA